MLGFQEDYKADELFLTMVEDISEGFIIRREIEKAVTGKAFFYNDPETKKPIRLPGISQEAFFHYYQLWEDYHYFGLPHGTGSIGERRWLLDFLKIFEKAFKDIENMEIAKAYKT